jgi:ubiquinone/menaquinone biosynthesis C-methylase UbiE
MIKQACPGAQVIGLDGDPQVLQIARRKIEATGLDIELHQGMAYEPPFPPASFDRVLTTLVLHHLTTDEKRQTLAGIRRLLRPAGELHIADFGKPQNVFMWLPSLSFRFFDGADRTAVNLRGQLPALVKNAGFGSVAETERHMTASGTLAFICAQAP